MPPLEPPKHPPSRRYNWKTIANIPRRFQLLVRHGFRCAYCGRDLGADVEAFMAATIDHVKPRSRGGQNCEANTVIACYWCNQLKADHEAASIDEVRQLIVERRAGVQKRLEVLQWFARTNGGDADAETPSPGGQPDHSAGSGGATTT